MIYENPNHRRVKGSRLLLITCGYCKKEIAHYQKVGKGNLLRMYVPRIVRSAVDLSKKPGSLSCPKCKKQLATRVTLRRKGKDAYVMKRSAFNSAEL